MKDEENAAEAPFLILHPSAFILIQK